MSRRTNREFVPLGIDFDSVKQCVRGFFASEKLDGTRAIWIPETRGIPVANIPFYNDVGDYRLKNRDIVSTGLWSRYGNSVRAPDWWVDKLPNIPLDGELYISRGKFQELRSIISSFEGGSRWHSVKYKVFDLLPVDTLLNYPGKINNPNYKMNFPVVFPINNINKEWQNWGFITRLGYLRNTVIGNSVVEVIPQVKLPLFNYQGLIDDMMSEIVNNAGEGLIFKSPYALWEPIRSASILKMKPEHFNNGVIIGYSAGEGKYDGMIGSLTVSWENKLFGLSGLTDEERLLTVGGQMIHFGIGDRVSFKYRELTDDGLPKEARYFRKVT